MYIYNQINLFLTNVGMIYFYDNDEILLVNYVINY